ncbi:MAG: 3-dehydroquinate synthase [Chlamydiia bacterium]|nr:3-dehydroquinate synthase [Chlamydiia bacterium]
MKISLPPVHWTSDLLGSEPFLKVLKGNKGPLVLISDDQVAPLYAPPLLDLLKSHDLQCALITFLAGESSKTRKTKETIEDALLAKKCGRDTLLIALGGGVVTDIVGFVAATYLRGISYLSVPTTLLGMVDASIGGKTGVNVSHAKNVIGAFYQPLAIFIDLSTLETLPDKELLAGSAEVLKYGLISDRALYDLLEEEVEEWTAREAAFLKKVVQKSIQIKQMVVQKDSLESGLRRILNFGHTIAHAIEALEEYALPHGEAVAIGMVIEALISYRLNHLKEEDFEAIYVLIKKMGFSLTLSHKVTTEKMKKALSLDKKSEKTVPRFVILDGIGKTLSFKGQYCTAIDETLLEEALGFMVAEFGV